MKIFKSSNLANTFLDKNLDNFQRHEAFTLAEVLITLGIIGIVAALTIPTLIANSQKTQYITQLKKAYSSINQALITMASNNGCTGDLKCTGLFATGTDGNSLGTELVKYFKTNKNCGVSTSHGCWPSQTSFYYDDSHPNDYINFDYPSATTDYQFITMDGISFDVSNMANDCKTNYSTDRTGNLKQVCGLIVVDVNGLKGPNKEGRDTFVFYISNGKGPLLYPVGGSDDNPWWKGNNRCGSANTYGTTCAGRVMEENWQMNY